MAFEPKPDPKYDPTKHTPKELTPKQQHDFWVGMVRFLGIQNPEYRKYSMRAKQGYVGTYDHDGPARIKARPSEAYLKRLPYPPEGYDDKKHD